MKKKKHSLLIALFVFFCLIIECSAASEYITLIDRIYIRKGPGTNYDAYTYAQVGTTYELLSTNIFPDERKNGSCDDGWYQINYNGSTAYACSEYVHVYNNTDTKTPTTSCEKKMQEAGFPSSYWKGLCSIQDSHSNWVFKAIDTKLDWKNVVERQSSCGKSLIETSNSEYIDKTCSAKEGGFKAASQKAVAFYMDPRNFLTEKYIFQFEYLKYDNDLANEYASAATKLFGTAAFYTYHKSIGNDLGSLVNQAGKEMDVNPISLASRIYQELGTSTSLYYSYSGLYEGYNKAYYGYYNFYNIGVTTSCNNQNGPVYCALDYAKKSGWNTVYAAVKGGASLFNSYSSRGQYTGYLQKYNVVPTDLNQLHTNQYMTNIAAPSSESISTYNSYKKLELLDKSFVFYIPVYANMDANIENDPNGAVDSKPSNTTPSTNDISTMITSAGYKISGKYITGIQVGMTPEALKNNIESVAGTGNVIVTNASGINITSGLIGTGYKIKVTNQNGTETYDLVVKGDTSGDGKINALDLLQVQQSILGTYSLKDAYSKAGDPSGDGKINALDLLQVQQSILGTYTIKQ